MKVNFAVLFSDKQIKRFTFINGLILILFLAVAFWKWSSLPAQIPLFYSLPRSTDQLGTPFKILILPSFSFMFSVVNLYLASLLYDNERLAAIILSAMSAVCSFLLFVTFVKIVFLVA